MRDDGRLPLDEDSNRNVRDDLLQEHGVTVAILKTYAAIRSRAGFEPAAENFLACWPSVALIAKDKGLHRVTVVKAIEWLHDRDFILRERRPRRSSVYYVILNRAEFLADVQKHGRADAIHLYHTRREDLGERSRSGQAEASVEKRKARQTRPTGRKSPVGYRSVDGDLIGSRETTSSVAGRLPAPVAARLPRTRDQENKRSVNESPTDVGPPLVATAPELPNDNGNGQGSPKERAAQPHRCEVQGDLRRRFEGSCADCQQAFLRDRFYAQALKRMGLDRPATREVTS